MTGVSTAEVRPNTSATSAADQNHNIPQSTRPRCGSAVATLGAEHLCFGKAAPLRNHANAGEGACNLSERREIQIPNARYSGRVGRTTHSVPINLFPATLATGADVELHDNEFIGGACASPFSHAPAPRSLRATLHSLSQLCMSMEMLRLRLNRVETCSRLAVICPCNVTWRVARRTLHNRLRTHAAEVGALCHTLHTMRTPLCVWKTAALRDSGAPPGIRRFTDSPLDGDVRAICASIWQTNVPPPPPDHSSDVLQRAVGPHTPLHDIQTNNGAAEMLGL